MTSKILVLPMLLLVACACHHGGIVGERPTAERSTVEALPRFAAAVCADLLTSGDRYLARFDHVAKDGHIYVCLNEEQTSAFMEELTSFDVDASPVVVIPPAQKDQYTRVPVLEMRVEHDQWASWFICKAEVVDRYDMGVTLGGHTESYWVTSCGIFFYHCYVETA